jgi:hypothetical protein
MFSGRDVDIRSPYNPFFGYDQYNRQSFPLNESPIHLAQTRRMVVCLLKSAEAITVPRSVSSIASMSDAGTPARWR